MIRRPLIRGGGLAAAQAAGRGDAAAVLLDHWPRARRPVLPAIPLPADADPSEFDWGTLRGLDVFILVLPGADRLRVARLVGELQAVQPRRLIVLLRGTGRHRFARSVARGVEWVGEATA